MSDGLSVSDAFYLVKLTSADEHYRQQHALLDWMVCPEPFCAAMKSALDELESSLLAYGIDFYEEF